MKNLMVISVVLAMAAAIVYFLMGVGVLTVPGLSSDQAPAAIPYVCGACYFLGGLLIFTGKRGLWIAGAVINIFVISIFFLAYNQKPDIMFSVPGLATKIAQILLEVGLISLIAAYKRKAQPAYQVAR